MERTYRAFALCALGLEKVLQTELERLGLKPSGRAPGRVYFEAELPGLFRANLCLRTAERVLLEAARYKAPDFDALFDGAKDIEWELFIGREDRLVIERVRSHDSQLSAQTAVQSIVQKAIYEHLGEVYRLERMPETGSTRSARVYIEDDECLIGLDLSGDALHKRGYRRSSVEAPLKETLAAAALLLSGWNRKIPLMDIFCGSGTILIEAGLFGLDIAPGLGRSFAMEGMPFADDPVFEAEREAARGRIRKDADLMLKGSDTDEAALSAARLNAKLAGLEDRIVFERRKAEEARAPEGMDSGYLISNPPYGNRLGTEAEAEEIYRKLGETAKNFKGWGLGFITNRRDFGSFFGRRATAEHKMMNGAEEQWLHWFPPGYEGTKARDFWIPEEGTEESAGAAGVSGGRAKEGQRARTGSRSDSRRDATRRDATRRDGPRDSGPRPYDTGRRGEGYGRGPRPYEAGHRGEGHREGGYGERRGDSHRTPGSSYNDRGRGEGYSRGPRSNDDRGPRSNDDRSPRSYADRSPRSYDDRGRGDRPQGRYDRDSRPQGPGYRDARDRDTREGAREGNRGEDRGSGRPERAPNYWRHDGDNYRREPQGGRSSGGDRGGDRQDRDRSPRPFQGDHSHGSSRGYGGSRGDSGDRGYNGDRGDSRGHGGYGGNRGDSRGYSGDRGDSHGPRGAADRNGYGRRDSYRHSSDSRPSGDRKPWEGGKPRDDRRPGSSDDRRPPRRDAPRKPDTNNTDD